MPVAGVTEACLVAGGQFRYLLEPALGAGRGEHLDDPGRLGAGVPHGVQHVARFERPRAGLCLRGFFADQHPDFTGQDVNPHVVAVSIRGDEGTGSQRLLEHGHDPGGLLGPHAHHDVERPAEVVALAGTDKK